MEKWSDGTYKMTRKMERFEDFLIKRFGRWIFWKWAHFRYKFMR